MAFHSVSFEYFLKLQLPHQFIITFAHTIKNNKGTANAKPSINKVSKEDEAPITVPSSKEAPPAPIRITLASLDEYNLLLANGLDFYGATFFPTEVNLPNLSTAKIYTKRGR